MQYFGSLVRLISSRRLHSKSLITFFSNKSSSMPQTSASGNGYVFSSISFKVNQRFSRSCIGPALFSILLLSLLEIFTGSTAMAIDSLTMDLEDLSLLLVSFFSLCYWSIGKPFSPWLDRLSSMSWARVASFSKV